MGTMRWSGALSVTAVVALLAVPGALHAQEGGHSHDGEEAGHSHAESTGEPATLEEAVTRLHSITEHFTGMRQAVEDNPSLAEQWATVPVLGAVENTAILSTRMAELLAALDAQVEGALASPEVQENHGVHERLTDLRADVDALTETLAGLGVKLQGFEDDFHAH